MSRSVMKIHHLAFVWSLVFSPTLTHPLQAVVCLDNGSIYCWDLQMGQHGQLNCLPVAHTGPIPALDWCSTGLDHTVRVRHFYLTAIMPDNPKVWGLPGLSILLHVMNKLTDVSHPVYLVRCVLWRPNYPCELVLVSYAKFSGRSGAEFLVSPRMQNAMPSFLSSTAPASESKDVDGKPGLAGDMVEIWDVCRAWLAKWTVDTSIFDGGVTGMHSPYLALDSC